ncbi:unnamed protein product [Calypogeia fissa]
MDPSLQTVKFGVLLPVTSRGLRDKDDCIRNLKNFSKSLKETTEGDTSYPPGHLYEKICFPRYELQVYVGVDESDISCRAARELSRSS